ncbi:MAG: signal peptidase II [Xanthobacteraceae bacterium]
MTDAAPAKAARFHVWGPLSALGLFVAVVACLLDQATKWWLRDVFRLPRHIAEPVAPFVNLTLTWNTGISYGLFPQEGPLGAWALLAFKIAAVIFLWLWLARAASRLTALALGLIIGGAIGNAIDRLHWPGVMDFVDLHVGNLHWYVFNLADVAIVAGVVALLCESLLPGSAAKAPRSGI